MLRSLQIPPNRPIMRYGRARLSWSGAPPASTSASGSRPGGCSGASDVDAPSAGPLSVGRRPPMSSLHASLVRGVGLPLAESLFFGALVHTEIVVHGGPQVGQQRRRLFRLGLKGIKFDGVRMATCHHPLQ